MSLQVLYEDNHILVAKKPANVPSQADASGDMDMLTLVKAYVKEKYAKPGEAYIGLVHRLDRPTAGVMVFARTSKAAARLAVQVRKGEMKKAYVALVHGKAPGGTMQDYLVQDSGQNKMAVCTTEKPGAKLALLYYAPFASKQNQMAVLISLLTGRKHQIRVQFAARGLPLVGDMKYGQAERGGLALYAAYLAFMHPVKKELMEFFSLPDTPVFDSFHQEIAGLDMEDMQDFLKENGEIN